MSCFTILHQMPVCGSKSGPKAQLIARAVSTVVVFALALFIGPLLFHHVNKVLSASYLIDIDIGTNGNPMPSQASKVITFDPGDSLLLSTTLERYPFVIADFNGEAIFHVNDDEPGCSSLNNRNDRYNYTHRDSQIRKRCRPTKFSESRLSNCMHSLRTRNVPVQVRRLSSFLLQRRITLINKLKVDAQGTDFAIVKDLLENAAHVRVKVLQVECQDYNQSVPLYFSSNDCSDIVTYVRTKAPEMTYRRVLNNCMAAEYNLIMNLAT